ncbi:hypothetical protein SAMN06265795_108133 [Noviherbaspirillum humi]|uniref:Uncharacterized protein n=1 Tax=Noviherbaspirillum humi TaxID=1688639 RepID=A0A239I609_9BURK|nr:hypothetical protein [Noviherbaspirillum humi]SNS88738.1 hypothetical protein SAMN06265795_108133 [Noviherbaspirillum humi]
MVRPGSVIALIFGTTLALTGCGGGGESPAASAGSPSGVTILSPTVYSTEGRPLNSCSFDARCSNNPYAPYTVFANPMPPDGSVLSGFVRLQVRGIDLGNVELLPASGYLPRYGVFTLSQDKTVAWLDLDTRTLPNGPVTARISAFNVAAGQPNAIELIAMSPRTWTISNAPLASGGFSAAIANAPGNGATVSGTIRIELRGSGIANAELLPASGYAPRLGQFNVSADRSYAWLDLDTRGMPDGPQSLRVSAFNVTANQPGAVEIVAMPARQWNVANGNDGSFTARLVTAPLEGEAVSGRITLEVQGAGIKNIELLPANGYTPSYGRFTTSFDGKSGFLDIDTASLPNGPIDVRVSAFNVAPGQAGAKEIVVMGVRRWVVRN